MNQVNDDKSHYDIIYADKHYCTPEWSWISDHNKWSGFHLWIVISGGATVKVEQEEYVLVPGDFFLFDLSRNHHCSHNPQNPLAVCAVYFHTDDKEELVSGFVQKGICPRQSVGNLSMNFSMFDHLSRAIYEKDNQAAIIWFSPFLHQFFSAGEHLEKTNPLIESICITIDEHPENRLDLDCICASIGYSKNQLIRLFKKYKGVTPYEYYINARISKSKHLLLYSNLSITQISSQLNYSDINHFTKQFLLKAGVTPKAYRLHH